MDILNVMKYTAMGGIVLVSLHIMYTIWYAWRMNKKGLNKNKI